MRMFIFPTVALAGLLATGDALAQGSQPPQGGMTHQGPMMQEQGEAARQMPQGQSGMMMVGCPMMQRMAAMETRLRQLEERAGIPAPAPSSNR